MLKSILVGLDGSAYSQAAADLGIQWARRSGALLVGLGIIDEPTIRKPQAVPLGAAYFKHAADESHVAHARRRVEQFLENFTLRCAEAGVACKLLEDVGVPYEQISLEAQRYDLILLGQQTYFQFETQEEACETLRMVLKSAPRPVVTVPETLRPGSSVVIAYDGSLQAARALQVFQASGLDSSQEVHVVSVDATHLEAARRAERAVEFLGFHQIKARPHAIAHGGSPAEVILQQAAEHQARLLVMGAYGQPTLREFVLGSVTRTVLRESRVPMFLYH